MSSYDRDERYFADDAETMVESQRWRWLIGIRYGVHQRILSRHTAFTLMILGTHMNSEGGRCWPSQARLADESGANRRTIRRHLDEATAAGWLFRVRNAGSGQSWARYSYQATLPAEVDDILDDYLSKATPPQEGRDKSAQPLEGVTTEFQGGGDRSAQPSAPEDPRNAEGRDISDEGGVSRDQGRVSGVQKVGTQLGPMRSSLDLHKDIHLGERAASPPAPVKIPEKKISIQEVAIRKRLSQGMTIEEVYQAAAGAIPLHEIIGINIQMAKEST